MKIPQNKVILFKSYRHYLRNNIIVPTSKKDDIYLCSDTTNRKQLNVSVNDFLLGEYILVKRFPDTVKYISFDYYTQNGCMVVFNDGNALFWYDGLTEGYNVCYETFVSITLMHQNKDFFSRDNCFAKFDQFLTHMKLWNIEIKFATPILYTISEVETAINTGKLKSIPTVQKTEQWLSEQEITKRLIANTHEPTKEQAKTAQNHAQLSMF